MTFILLSRKKKSDKEPPEAPMRLGVILKVCKLLVNYDTSRAIKKNHDKYKISEASVWIIMKYLRQIGALTERIENGQKVYVLLSGKYRIRTAEGLDGYLILDSDGDTVEIGFVTTEKVL